MWLSQLRSNHRLIGHYEVKQGEQEVLHLPVSEGQTSGAGQPLLNPWIRRHASQFET